MGHLILTKQVFKRIIICILEIFLPISGKMSGWTTLGRWKLSEMLAASLTSFIPVDFCSSERTFLIKTSIGIEVIEWPSLPVCEHDTIQDYYLDTKMLTALPPMKSTAGGEMHGLQVYLDVQSDQYLRTNIQSGFKVRTITLCKNSFKYCHMLGYWGL